MYELTDCIPRSENNTVHKHSVGILVIAPLALGRSVVFFIGGLTLRYYTCKRGVAY